MLSIAVDPALIFNLFRVFAALACIAISGFLLVYFAFGIRHPLTAIATALPIGLASTLLVSNLLAYILGTPRALTWGLLAVFVITSLIAVARRHLFKPVQPVSWLDGALFAAAGILLLILSVANYAVFTTVDYNMHFWLANTIRFGNFPVMAPGAPMLRVEYHYGVDLLAAALAHIGQLDSAIIFFILTPIAAISAYLAASVLAAHVLGNIRLGLLAGLFFSFGGGLSFVTPLIRSSYLNWWMPPSALAQDELSDYLQSVSPNIHAAFPQFITYPHRLVAWACLLSCIIIAFHLDHARRKGGGNGSYWHLWIGLGVLFSSIALTEVTLFVLGLVGWGSYALYQTFLQRQPVHIRNYALAAAPATLFALLQGGVLTTALFYSPQGDLGLGSVFILNVLPQPVLLGEMALRSTYPLPWLPVYLVALGLPLIAAPALVFWTLRHREPTPLVWLISIGLIGLIVPHFVTHQYSSNFARWIQFSQASLSLVLGIGVLTLLAQFTRRSLAWIILTACAALTIGWPLAVSIKNVSAERRLSIGKSIEDQWTLSPPLRQSHHVDLLTGRSYPFLMGGEARNFLRSLPPTARVLTNQFPEVPLLIRGFAPHKNTDLFSYTNFQFPAPDYFDALYSLDIQTMQEFGITHLVLNLKWFLHASPDTQALLQDSRYFSLDFSDEQYHEGLAWHRIYRVLPAFYEAHQPTDQDLLRNIPRIIPKGASVYISPAIPQDIRWALLYTLRGRQTASAQMDENHTKARLVIEEPQPADHYDFALLIDEPPGERWLNWAFTPQDLPSAWGLHPSQQIWHALGIGLYSLQAQGCAGHSFASVPSRQLPANRPFALDLRCLGLEAGSEANASSLLLTILSPKDSQLEVVVNGLSRNLTIETGANQVPLTVPSTQRVTIIPADPIWMRAQRVPRASSELQTGIPALLLLPTLDGERLLVSAHFYGKRSDPEESKLVWELVKQRRIYGHWWHWSSPDRVGVWPLALSESPDDADQFTLALDFSSLETTFTINGQTVSIAEGRSLPEHPGEPYVLYFTLIRKAARAHSLPVAWITYSPEEKPSVLLAPRFILVDKAYSQD